MRDATFVHRLENIIDHLIAAAVGAATGDLRICPEEFDEVAAELGQTLDFFKVAKREKAEVPAAFAAHKDEVTAGYVGAKRGWKPGFPSRG